MGLDAQIIAILDDLIPPMLHGEPSIRVPNGVGVWNATVSAMVELRGSDTLGRWYVTHDTDGAMRIIDTEAP